MSLRLALRSRPGLILALTAWRFAAAWLVGLPIVAQVYGSGVSQLVEGERALFAPGGLILAEVLSRLGSALASALGVSTVLFCVAWVLSLAPLSLFIVGLAKPGRLTFAEHGLATLRSFPRIAVIAVGTLALQGLAVLLGTLAVAVLAALAESSSQDVRAMIIGSGLSMTLLAWLSLAGLRDLGYAALVNERVGLLGAFGISIRTLRRSPRAILGAYTIFSLSSAFLVILNALVANAADVSRAGSYRIVFLFVIHQLTLFGLTALRGGWLCTGLATISSWSQAPDGKRARSDAMADPNPGLAASSDPPAPNSAVS